MRDEKGTHVNDDHIILGIHVSDRLIAQRVREMDDVRRAHTQKMLDKVRAGERDVLC